MADEIDRPYGGTVNDLIDALQEKPEGEVLADKRESLVDCGGSFEIEGKPGDPWEHVSCFSTNSRRRMSFATERSCRRGRRCASASTWARAVVLHQHVFGPFRRGLGDSRSDVDSPPRG